MRVVDPQIELLGYGPQAAVEGIEGFTIGPTDIIASAARMTYKDVTALETIIDTMQEEGDVKKETQRGIMASVRRGHASATTSSGIWVGMSGVSKLIDSMFTGGSFVSALAPSGRRIPVTVDNIMATQAIAADTASSRVFERNQRELIELYEASIEAGVPKQEAAKITPYGLSGGLFAYLPLESIVAFKNAFEANADWIPQEGHQVIEALEGVMKDIDADLLYHARVEAARNTGTSPSIFTNPNNPTLAGITRKVLSPVHTGRQKDVQRADVVIDALYHPESKLGMALVEDIARIEGMKKEILSDPDTLSNNWKKLLLARNDFATNWTGIVNVDTATTPSWRVWGEVKRHRTMPQQVQSVYDAVREILDAEVSLRGNSGIPEEILERAFEIPESVKDAGVYDQWIDAIRNSLNAYEVLPVPESEKVGVIPRGVRLGVKKSLGLWNLMEGYVPLRLCKGTVEPEMYRITKSEVSWLSKGLMDEGLEELTGLIGPKCHSAGWCLEPRKVHEGCNQISKAYVGLDSKYTPELHRQVQRDQRRTIEEKL
jgi:hypothetical protein